MKIILNPLKAINALLFTGLSLGLALTASAQEQQSRKIHVGIVYPISTNGTHAGLDSNKFSFNLIGGLSAGEQGATIAGITNVVRGNARGLQLAGFSNHISKTAGGAQFAGFMNTYGAGEGFAIAGFTNIAAGKVTGAQFAGFANIAKDTKGLQLAGFLNKAGELSGSQFAGFANIAKSVSAVQLAGFLNKANDVKGSQIAGFINIAKKVKGVQFASFMNVADSSDYPIGFINIVKNGEKSLAITTDEHLTTLLSFRSGGKYLYGILGVGYNFENKDKVYAYEAGFGAHLFQSTQFRVNTEIVASSLLDFKRRDYFKSSLRILPAFKLSQSIEIFAGPALHFVNTDSEEGKNMTKHYIKSWDLKSGNNLNALYLGYTGGIQYIF